MSSDIVNHPSSVTMPFKLLGDTSNVDECTVSNKFAPCSKYNFLPTIRDVLDNLRFRWKTIKIGDCVVPSICGNIRNSCNSPCINLYRNKEFFDIERKGSNVEQVIITDSADDMNIFVSNMPNAVMIDDSDNYVWFNISQKITIEIYGENPDNPMNASISIMGCGLNVFIDEDEMQDFMEENIFPFK